VRCLKALLEHEISPEGGASSLASLMEMTSALMRRHDEATVGHLNYTNRAWRLAHHHAKPCARRIRRRAQISGIPFNQSRAAI
jgi:hypothetical protein